MEWIKDVSLKKKFFGVLIVIVVIVSIVGVLFFTSFNTLGTSAQRQMAASDLSVSILMREVQHLQWVNSLSSYLAVGEATDLHINKDGLGCAFGQWYNSEESRQIIEQFPEVKDEFIAIDKPHITLHQSAAKIEEFQKNGDLQGAREVYEKVTLPTLVILQKHFASISKTLSTISNDLANQSTEISESLQMYLMLICLLGGIIFIAFAFTFLKFILAPITAITTYARDSLAGKKATLNIEGNDEMGILSESLNTLMANLQSQLAYSKGILGGITVPCVVISPEDKIVFNNQYIVDLLERPGTCEDAIGLSSGEFFFGDASVETVSAVALRERRSILVERTIKSFNGKEIHIIISSSPFYDEEHHLLGALTIWSNVTEIVENQQIIEANAKHIAEVARSASEVAQNVSSSSTELAAQVEQASKGASLQSVRVSEAAETMSQMNIAVLEVAENASNSSQTAAEAMSNASNGSKVVNQMTDSFQSVEKYTEEVKNGMDGLGKQADGVGAIIRVITDIADQTNLLALNAAIEAARAGEAGRGFAVVADEVRKLAEKTMQATSEVSSVIIGIQAGTNDSIASVERTVQAVDGATGLAVEAGNTLETIVEIVEKTANQIQSIASAAEEQSQTSGIIHEKLEEVRNISEETATAMNCAAAEVEALAEQARALNDLIKQLQDS